MLVSKIENGRRTAEEITIGTIAAAVYYVDIATGSDSNNGLSAGAAFKTIQHALDLFSNKIVIGTGAKIRVCAGDYSGEGQLVLRNCVADSLTITAFDGSNDVTAVNTTYKIDSIAIYSSNFIALYSLNATSTTASVQMFSANESICYFQYCSSTSSSTGQVGVYFFLSRSIIANCSFSNKNYVIVSTRCSVVYSDTQTAGSGNTIGLYASAASIIGKNGTQPQGSTAEQAQSGSQIL